MHILPLFLTALEELTLIVGKLIVKLIHTPLGDASFRANVPPEYLIDSLLRGLLPVKEFILSFQQW